MLTDVSNPEMVYKRAKKLYGDNIIIKESTRKDKKYMILDNNKKYIHFGSINHLDYTKYLELYGLDIANNHKERYLKRALNIKGNWKNNIYSPNNLSIHLLWFYNM